ncbi:MAG: NTP transferase domain-containing protein, partial [Synechococcales cyanobacterium CRU_2_2]|nr:NTP transferase domain-containing protein [Synechococcales cyanobacterium CRU_2_2]
MSGIVGLVLAGGRSARMGGADKALVTVAGKSLLARVVERINPQVEGLVLSANGDPSRFSKFGIPIVPDTVDGVGPLAGLHAGMRWSEKNLPEARFVASVAAAWVLFLIVETGLRLIFGEADPATAGAIVRLLGVRRSFRCYGGSEAATGSGGPARIIGAFV